MYMHISKWCISFPYHLYTSVLMAFMIFHIFFEKLLFSVKYCNWFRIPQQTMLSASFIIMHLLWWKYDRQQVNSKRQDYDISSDKLWLSLCLYNLDIPSQSINLQENYKMLNGFKSGYAFFFTEKCYLILI